MSHQGRGIALRGFVAAPRLERAFSGSCGNRRDAIAPQLRKKRGGAGVVGQRFQRTQRILGPQRQHRTERIRVHANSAKLLQKYFERLVVSQRTSLDTGATP